MAKKISDDAVQKSTGKTWKNWFSLLNKAGAKKMEHKDIAQLLYKKYGLSGWRSQMVTVQYEQDIKGRKKHETTSGFQISKSVTLITPVTKVFNTINSPLKRIVWLEDPAITISKSTKDKSIRGKWIDKKTNIEFQFYPKENSKTQLVVQQSKIKTAKEAEKMKTYWEKQLKNLKKYLEKH
ncbi:MAG: SRPBCC domain-containing protein [bacterium]|nr:SRPBCC domain-containing protein [bacterium]